MPLKYVLDQDLWAILSSPFSWNVILLDFGYDKLSLFNLNDSKLFILKIKLQIFIFNGKSCLILSKYYIFKIERA